MTHLFECIRLLDTSTRGVNPALARLVVKAMREQPGPRAEELREAFRPWNRVLQHPSVEECLNQLSLLQFEHTELSPWVEDVYPEHRSECTLSAFLAVESGISHFQRKLHALTGDPADEAPKSKGESPHARMV